MRFCLRILQQGSKTSFLHPLSTSSAFSFSISTCRFTVQAFQSRRYASISASELQFGQPVYETHPHLLKIGEVTPGITALEYAHRRSKLASKLPANSIAIVAASEVKFRSGAVFYEFHQDSNFFYLTGFNEPEAVAVIGGPAKLGEDHQEKLKCRSGKIADENDHEFHLFVRPKDPKAELWEGPRSGTEAAVDVFNADATGNIDQLQDLLSPIVNGASEIYTDLVTNSTTTSVYSRFLPTSAPKAESLAKILESRAVKPLKPIMNDIRVFKSNAEVANMRKAGQISGRVFTEAMKQSWTAEKDLGAFLDYKFKQRGCDTSAYMPVVAGGQRGKMIHYVRNDDILKNGELVLVDAGGQYGGYITDITRTFPIDGKFTPAQKDLYAAVLLTQRACIALCRASANISLNKLHSIAESTLRDQLIQLGFDMSSREIETLFPHHLSHYIGLDVHDTPGQSRHTSLQAGQCVTVEPGLYIPDSPRYPAHFRGLNVRVEDSVCVQEEHPLVLTTEAVKEVEDIEALRS